MRHFAAFKRDEHDFLNEESANGMGNLAALFFPTLNTSASRYTTVRAHVIASRSRLIAWPAKRGIAPAVFVG